MFKSRIMLTALLGGAVLAGCKKEEPKPEPAPVTGPTVPTPPKAAAPATPAAPAVPAVPATPATPAASAPKTVTPAPTLSSPSSLEAPATPAVPATPPPVTTTTPDATAAPEADAKSTLADFQTHLLAKNWDACGKDLKKLNGMRDKLSPDMKNAIDKAKATLTAAKTADSLQIPGVSTPKPDPNK